MLALELVAQGLVQGSLYALIALGLTLVSGIGEALADRVNMKVMRSEGRVGSMGR